MPLELSSPAFDDGDPIPRSHGYREGNVSPPLALSGVPDAAESLVLVVDDPDAVGPAGTVWDHWLVWNVDPGHTRLPEGWDPASAGAVEGTNDFGEVGYGGPSPPEGEHTYRFRAYALDARLDLDSSADKATLVSAMQDHVLDDAELTGTYAP
jgi:hypothetical protein